MKELLEFEFATTKRILFGIGKRKLLPDFTREYGKNVLVIRGFSTERAQEVVKYLGIKLEQLPQLIVTKEPTLDLILEGLNLAKKSRPDWILGIGGGSVIDTAKAIAVLVTNPGHPLEYLEVVGLGKPLKNPPLPCVVLPTTSGTGAEATRNSVIGLPEYKLKVSLRHFYLLPNLAIVDPELTLTLPPYQTAITGLDALTQLIEAYLSSRVTPLIEALCKDAIPRAIMALPLAVTDGANLTVRTQMAYVSLVSGIALANSGLGAVHGLAGPLGGWLNAPHGAICGRLLPAVLKFNTMALMERDPTNPALARIYEIAKWITGSTQATVEDAVTVLLDMLHQFQIPKLSFYGLKPEDIPNIVLNAQNSSSMKANPIKLTVEELNQILLQNL